MPLRLDHLEEYWGRARSSVQAEISREGERQMEAQADRTMEQAAQPVLLRMEHISKSFPGVKALDDVSMTVKAGTVHALMGENGAGKSTLMKCLFGIYSKDEGHIFLEGKEVDFKSSREALDNGVAMVHQELNQALRRNVMDNIWLGRYPKIKGTPAISESICTGIP